MTNLSKGNSPELAIDLSKYPDNYALYYTNTSDNSQKQWDTVNSLANNYQHKFGQYSNVRAAFHLSDTDIVKFCPGLARNTIEAYYRCISLSNVRMFHFEHYEALDFSYTYVIKGRERKRLGLRALGHFNNQVASIIFNFYL